MTKPWIFDLMEARLLARLLEKSGLIKKCSNIPNIFSQQALRSSFCSSRYSSGFDDELDFNMPREGKPMQRKYEGRMQNHGYSRSGKFGEDYSNFGRRQSGFGEQDSYSKFEQRNSYNRQRDSYGHLVTKSYGGRSQQTFDIPTIDWSSTKLETIVKDIYVESDVVKNRSLEEIDDFRSKNEISINGLKGTLNPIIHFSDYQFPNHLMEALNNMNFESPMPIQSVTWPILLSGHDVIGIGQTGSGKTLGFTLPAVCHGIAQTDLSGAKILVLAPTRELAQQISGVFETICQFTKVKVACLFGGAPKQYQYLTLQAKPMIVVATPGRLMDLMAQRVINLQSVTCMILDEADRMLDMGFEPQINQILQQIRPDRQTLMWSATWPQSVQHLARNLTNNPVHINIGSSELKANPDITQKFIFCSTANKMPELRALIQKYGQNSEKILIFAETQKGVSRLCERLRYDRFQCDEIHGGLKQNSRDRVINGFKRGSIQIVIATDVASRGLDVNDISLVVNFDMPNDIEGYVHRIGRTARAGKKGNSISFYTNDDQAMAQDLAKILRKSGQEVPADFESYLRPGRQQRY